MLSSPSASHSLSPLSECLYRWNEVTGYSRDYWCVWDGNVSAAILALFFKLYQWQQCTQWTHSWNRVHFIGRHSSLPLTASGWHRCISSRPFLPLFSSTLSPAINLLIYFPLAPVVSLFTSCQSLSSLRLAQCSTVSQCLLYASSCTNVLKWSCCICVHKYLQRFLFLCVIGAFLRVQHSLPLFHCSPNDISDERYCLSLMQLLLWLTLLFPMCSLTCTCRASLTSAKDTSWDAIVSLILFSSPALSPHAERQRR